MNLSSGNYAKYHSYEVITVIAGNFFPLHSREIYYHIYRIYAYIPRTDRVCLYEHVCCYAQKMEFVDSYNNDVIQLLISKSIWNKEKEEG